MWLTASPSTRAAHLPSGTIPSEVVLNCILKVISALWVDSTKELYNTSLLVFHVHCDINDIPELEHCPISHPTLLAFISSCAGAYSDSKNPFHGITVLDWPYLSGM